MNDYPVVVAGLAHLLAQHSAAVRVVQLSVGSRVVEDEVDLVVFDLFAQAVDVEQLISSIGARVIVFSDVRHPQAVAQALDAGAAGYVYKGVAPQQLVDCIMAAFTSSTPVVALDPDPALPPAVGRWPGLEHALTQREAEVVALICDGLTNAEIADHLYVSINSVKTYIRLTYAKIGVDSRAKAVAWGGRYGFVGPPRGWSDTAD